MALHEDIEIVKAELKRLAEKVEGFSESETKRIWETLEKLEARLQELEKTTFQKPKDIPVL